MLQAQLFSESHELAAQYLSGIPLVHRRAAGQVYTPLHLVRFILDQAGYVPDAEIESATLLDPSCGCGVFLEQAVWQLATHLASRGVSFSSRAGRQRLVQAVAHSIYGIDLDPQACEFARQAVRSTVAGIVRSPLPIDFFERNVIRADFLLSGVSTPSSIECGGFDFIVGNPPYVSANRLDPSYKNMLRAALRSASGRLELYTLFIERALSLLCAGGRLAFITPDKFLVSQSAQALRSLIAARDTVQSIATFPSHRVFGEAATVPCVTVIERAGPTRPAEDVQVLECSDQPSPDGTVRVRRRWNVPRAWFGSSGWRITPPNLAELADRMCTGRPRLAELADRVSAGIASGRDGLYVLQLESPAIEAELLRPAVRGRDISAYRITTPRLQIIVPYVFDESGRGSLIDLRDYPKARSYFEEHRQTLETRHCVRVWKKAWYDLHDPISLDLASQAKIIVPDVACESRFAFDGGRYVPLHSTYYIVPRRVDPHFLTGVLNSTPLEFLVRLFAPRVKDGFSRYRRQFLLMLPVPAAPSATVSMVAEAAALGDAPRVDELVSEAFNLAPRELALIHDFLERARNPHDLLPTKPTPA